MARKGTLTIPSGQSASNALPLEDEGARRALTALILAPATLDALTFTVEVSEKPGGTFRTLRSGGADVTLSAGKAEPITILTAGELRIKASGPVAADRSFDLIAVARD